ncbi:MAG: HAD-IA family hydrolase [Bacteroidales bacterium]|nr:HAD-IA family hydrolase [Bacteroidales bacterium]
MNIRLVIFDFDGTMADTRHNIVITMQRVMRELGMPVADEETCASTIGLPLKDCFRKIFPELTDDAAEHCAETYRQIFFANAKSLVPNMFPNVQETIDLLHAHQIKMAIASSRTSASLHGFINEMHLTDKIAMVVGSDEVTHHKPHPEPVNVILSALGVPASETLVVGDMPVDILMGTAAGTHTCAVTYGNASAEELSAAGAEFLIDDMAEVVQLVISDGDTYSSDD